MVLRKARPRNRHTVYKQGARVSEETSDVPSLFLSRDPSLSAAAHAPSLLPTTMCTHAAASQTAVSVSEDGSRSHHAITEVVLPKSFSSGPQCCSCGWRGGGHAWKCPFNPETCA
ncbi:unnamed protein product [Mycena citricolor]|uniref:Uncharacterized protein n=1 Tax=Mycena citricolor TaxID=2018698 RepID=A0AAD2Q351_9AGAR|nr:unnamed protein product [Mycena citricolor]